jgi:colicin import membrane protein
MTAAAAAQAPRRPDANPDTVPAFVMAVAMHALLVGAMWFAVRWDITASAPAVAELWEPPPEVEMPAPAPPAPQPAPPPPQVEPEHKDADIVEKETVKPKPPPPPVEHKPVEAKKPEAKVKPVPKPSAAELKRQEEEAEQRQQTELARLTSQASASPVSRTPSVSSPGVLSNEYQAKIVGAIRSHLSYAVPEGVSDKVYAEFKVELLPTGEQAAEPQLIKPSGLPSWDDAARRAILRTDPFPRRDDGTVPPTLTLRLYPVDAR